MSIKLLLTSTIKLMTVFLFGSCGEILNEKSGHLNMGIPGVMALGGLGGYLGEALYMISIGREASRVNPFLCVLIPIIFAVIFGALGGLLFSFFTVTLKCNQNVIGLILTTFGVALAISILTNSSKVSVSAAGVYFSSLFFPGKLDNLNFFQSVFLSHGILTYLSIIIAILLAIFLNKTRTGLSLRAIGENPSAADSCGLNVNKYRYITTMVGCAIAALGGLFIIMDFGKGTDPSGSGSMIESYGWLAVALVIFSMWKPSLSILGSFIFSFFATLPTLILVSSTTLKEFLKMIPYIMTIIILIITSIFKFKNSKAPEALGQSYFREDR